jgi:adenosylcobinamide hydrolase
MKTARFALSAVVITFLLSGVGLARDITLPDAVEAKASVQESTKDGFWEKTLIVTFPGKRHLLSTNDGFVDVPVAANHSAHPSLWMRDAETMKDNGKGYEAEAKERICRKLGVQKRDIAMMSTAADMDNLAVIKKGYGSFVVTALVTAGAKTNALRAGLDQGAYIEGETNQKAVPPGTVNILILTNVRLTDGAMARAIIMATEAKTAAFEDLHVPSSAHPGVQATGTGTDSLLVVSGTTGQPITYTGGHGKIGELIGKAVYDAVVEALGKQNGFKKSLQAGIVQKQKEVKREKKG